jgi:O-antigen/teichoic acid export membrane protein
METSRVFKNAGAAAAQVVVSRLLLFLLYRYLLATVGVDRMGIWSVVLAATSASRITELGLTSGVVKFVAKYIANRDYGRAGGVVQTAAISLGAFVGAILAAAYSPLGWILARLLPESALPEALAILPFALVSLWITTLGGIFQSGLDGCQRTDLRAGFNILNNLLYLLLSVAMVPRFGLLGLAYVQVFLAALLTFLSWIFLRREVAGLPWLPCRWNRPLFREMLVYGLNIQVGTLVQMLYDPVTKALLSKFGTLAMVGYYEMASRMILQFRGLLTAPSQVLVPVVAQLQETEAQRIKSVYRDSCRLQAYLSLPVYGGILAVLPGISELWIGGFEQTFILFSMLLVLGWFLNGLVNPAYFGNLGIGRLGWNMWSHVAIGILNGILGLAIGVQLGGMGVVLAWVIALAAGSSIVILAFHVEHAIGFSEMFPLENVWLLLACGAGAGAAWLAYFRLDGELGAAGSLLAGGGLFLSAVAIPAWFHPMRARLFGMLRKTRTA